MSDHKPITCREANDRIRELEDDLERRKRLPTAPVDGSSYDALWDEKEELSKRVALTEAELAQVKLDLDESEELRVGLVVEHGKRVTERDTCEEIVECADKVGEALAAALGQTYTRGTCWGEPAADAVEWAQQLIQERDAAIARAESRHASSEWWQSECVKLRTQLTEVRQETIKERLRADKNECALSVAESERSIAVRERDEAVEELAIWKSVFPDIAPESVLPDRSVLEAELREANARAEKAGFQRYAHSEEVTELRGQLAEAIEERDTFRALCERAEEVLTAVMKSDVLIDLPELESTVATTRAYLIAAKYTGDDAALKDAPPAVDYRAQRDNLDDATEWILRRIENQRDKAMALCERAKTMVKFHREVSRERGHGLEIDFADGWLVDYAALEKECG